MQDAKEEIRARLNIEDVIAEYMVLKRAGRNFKGLSPFTSEKTPSFVVSPDKQIWHDFSSNKGGDLFSFVMLAEGMDFRQAIEHLANKAGVDLSQYEKAGDKTLAARKKRAIEANRLAVAYYQQSLLKNQHALDYVFTKRKLTKDIVETFGIGYAPSSGDALINFLTKKGFSKKELNDAGLTNRFGGDLFRSRMMIPLGNASGETIGFTARIIDEEPNAPKYLNTPQTLLYDKGRHIFGLSQAKESIRRFDYAVVVEGNLDVISSHQVGVVNVVATAGTAMTESHLKSLSRLTHNIRLAYDTDKAGLAATERAISLAQNIDVNLSIISLMADAKDPDELIQKDLNLWKQAIEETKPAIDWVLEQYERREDLTTSLGKKRYSAAALQLIKGLSDKVEQEHYLGMVSKVINTSLETLKDKLVEEKPQVINLKPTHKIETETNDNSVLHDNLLAVLITDSATHDLLIDFDENMFESEERRAIANYINANRGKDLSKVPDSLQNFDTYVKILLLKAETRYAEWSAAERYYETARLLRQISIQNKKKTKDILTEDLRQAEASGKDDLAHELRLQINKLIKEISSGR